MMVLLRLAPISDSDFPITMSPSMYFPDATWIVSPALAAATAAPLVAKQPPLPLGFTQSVAAAAANWDFLPITFKLAALPTNPYHILVFIPVTPPPLFFT